MVLAKPDDAHYTIARGSKHVDRMRGEDKYQVHRSKFHLFVRGIRGEVYNIPCGSLGPDIL